MTAKSRAFAWSLAVHAIAFGLLFVGLRWTQSEKPLSVAGPIIEAALVIDPDAKRPAVTKPKPKPPKPKPKPAPEPEPPKPPEPDPAPDPTPPRAEDPRDQQLIDELGLQEAADREREQEEMRLREQIELEAEERRERERDEQLEDIERDRREEEERRMEELLEQERAEQDAQPRPGNEGVDESLLAQYAMALSQVIEINWTRPDTVPLGSKCKIVIIQAPGGEVVGAKVDPSCPYDEIGRRSLEAAVMKASPLPYDGFEDVFDPQLNLTFTPDDRY